MEFIKEKKYQVIESKHGDYKIGDFFIYEYQIGDVNENLHIVNKDDRHYIFSPNLVKVIEVE